MVVAAQDEWNMMLRVNICRHEYLVPKCFNLMLVINNLPHDPPFLPRALSRANFFADHRPCNFPAPLRSPPPVVLNAKMSQSISKLPLTDFSATVLGKNNCAYSLPASVYTFRISDFHQSLARQSFASSFLRPCLLSQKMLLLASHRSHWQSRDH